MNFIKTHITGVILGIALCITVGSVWMAYSAVSQIKAIEIAVTKNSNDINTIAAFINNAIKPAK